MSSYSEYKTDICSGYSIRGSIHEREDKPNQDCFLIRLSSRLKVFVVADGVGSNAYAQKGSKYICKAVKKAFLRMKRKDVEEEKLFTLIYFFYKKGIKKKERNQVGTTCIFAVIRGKKLYVGQAGDGVFCIKTDEKFKMTGRKTDDFANEVHALSDKREYHSWKFKVIDLEGVSVVELMLMTDGVSDDVLPNKMSEFMSFVFSKAEEDKDYLKNLLGNWNMTGSADDKTIVLARLINDIER